MAARQSVPKTMAKRSMGENIEGEVKNGVLTLTIDLKHKGRPSASGKTTLIATSGNPPPKLEGGLTLNVNLYKK